MLKTDESLDFTLQPGLFSSHIHFIEDSKKLVVTSSVDKSITIIDMKNRKTEKSILVASLIYGIVHKDGKLLYNGCQIRVCVACLDNDSVKKIVNVTLSQYSGIAIWSDQLNYINNDDNSVTCCDLQGKLKWKLELAAFLSDASGITVDLYGRVYVSGYWSDNVVVISPDGDKHRVLLSENDDLQHPQALFFDCKNNKLLISNERDVAFLYDVFNCSLGSKYQYAL